MEFLLVFYYCDKIPEKNNLKEEKFILVHGFRGFSAWSVQCTAFGPEVGLTPWQRVGGKVKMLLGS